jgi:AP2-like factor (euAP2 lineage)
MEQRIFMKSFESTRKGVVYTILIDDEDWDKVMEYNWFVEIRYGRITRVLANICIDGIWKRVSLHVFLMGKQEGMVIDHDDGKPLNNQKKNLVFRTPAENIQKRGRTINRKHGAKYRGVRFLNDGKRKKPWQAYIRVNGKMMFLGYYATQEEAAVAFNKAAIKYWGLPPDSVGLNPIPSHLDPDTGLPWPLKEAI